MFACLQGEYDPTTTKVLHFRMNPSSVAQQKRRMQVDELNQENEKLKKRISILEEEGQAAADLTMKVEARTQEPSTSKQVKGKNIHSGRRGTGSSQSMVITLLGKWVKPRKFKIKCKVMKKTGICHICQISLKNV